MSLNIDCTKCSDQSEAAKEIRTMWMSIVAHLMMFTGTSTFRTDKQFDEAFRRIDLWESEGPLAGDVHGPVTRDTLNAFRGCSANVSPMSPAAFRKRAADYLILMAERRAAQRKAV